MTIQSFKGIAANFKGNIAKLVAAGLLAGAFALATPTRANAQEVVVVAANPHYILAGFDRGRHFENDCGRPDFRRREDWRRDRYDHRFDRRCYR